MPIGYAPTTFILGWHASDTWRSWNKRTHMTIDGTKYRLTRKAAFGIPLFNLLWFLDCLKWEVSGYSRPNSWNFLLKGNCVIINHQHLMSDHQIYYEGLCMNIDYGESHYIEKLCRELHFENVWLTCCADNDGLFAKRVQDEKVKRRVRHSTIAMCACCGAVLACMSTLYTSVTPSLWSTQNPQPPGGWLPSIPLIGSKSDWTYLRHYADPCQDRWWEIRSCLIEVTRRWIYSGLCKKHFSIGLKAPPYRPVENVTELHKTVNSTYMLAWCWENDSVWGSC